MCVCVCVLFAGVQSGTWRPARVFAHNAHSGLTQVHFLGLNTSHARWIDANSSSLCCPLFSSTYSEEWTDALKKKGFTAPQQWSEAAMPAQVDIAQQLSKVALSPSADVEEGVATADSAREQPQHAPASPVEASDTEYVLVASCALGWADVKHRFIAQLAACKQQTASKAVGTSWTVCRTGWWRCATTSSERRTANSWS